MSKRDNVELVSCDGSDVFDDEISGEVDVIDDNGVCVSVDCDVNLVVVGEVAVSIDDETGEDENVVNGIECVVDKGDEDDEENKDSEIVESDFAVMVVDEGVEILVSDFFCVDIEVDNGND